MAEFKVSSQQVRALEKQKRSKPSRKPRQKTPRPNARLSNWLAKQKIMNHCPNLNCCLLRLGNSSGPLRHDDQMMMMTNIRYKLSQGVLLPHNHNCPTHTLSMPTKAQVDAVVSSIPIFEMYPCPPLLVAVTQQISKGRTRPQDGFLKLTFARDCLLMLGGAPMWTPATPSPAPIKVAPRRKRSGNKARVARGPNPAGQPQFIRRGRAMDAKTWRKEA